MSVPSIAFPSTFSATQDVTLTWTPDPNAQSITIAIADDYTASSVACQLADSAGTVTIDASLLGSLNAADKFRAFAYRETDKTIEDGETPVTMRSFGETDRTAMTMK